MISKRHAEIFIATLSTILFFTGVIYGFNNELDLTSYLETLNTNNNLYLYHILVIIFFFVATLSIFGTLINSIIIGIESISIGYILSNFIQNYKFKGFIYGIINILINKGLYIIVLIYLFIIGINYIKKIYLNLIGINKNYTCDLIIPLIKKYIVILIIIFIYDTIIYFFGNMFLNYLTFML